MYIDSIYINKEDMILPNCQSLSERFCLGLRSLIVILAEVIHLYLQIKS